jgi:subtilisin family serine protease
MATAVAATAALVVTAGLAGTGQASAADPKLKPAVALKAPRHELKPSKLDGTTKPMGLMPRSGTHAFLLKLTTRPTQQAFASTLRTQGKAAAKAAARNQLSTVRASQDRVTAALPKGTTVLYKTHAALNTVAVRTDAKNVRALRGISGVAAIYPIAPKKPSNSYAVPLVGGPAAWTAFGDLGENTSIAIIDTGLDYTHANFGGPGTEAAYTTAHAAEASPADPTLFPSAKIVDGYDFAGDAYDAGGDTPAQTTPVPDPNPLDCQGHGSHVGGTAAGYGVNANGTTYTGVYNNTTPFSTMKIGPGMAPKADLIAYRVFGCDGSSNVVGEAMDRAADPNNDGDPSDHVDVVNMSLGSDFGSSLDGDAVLANQLAELGVNVVIASGNGGDLYDVGGSPGNAPRTLTVANSVDASSVIDALHVSAPASIAGAYGAERSLDYDWAADPDLSGTLAPLTQTYPVGSAENLTGQNPDNKDGCNPLNPADTAAVDGKVAFLEWDSNDATRQCGSVARSTNVKNAGAIGFVFADDEETFSASISGSAVIPGVMVTKSAGDAIRAHLAENVTVSGTTANGFTQLIPADNDKVGGSSSRNSRNPGGIKPDVAGVGTSVFSTAVGTGNDGISFTGTSMATPQVAGLTSLVVSEHPDWTTEEVKADIMNTAGQDLFTGDFHTGAKFAPNRVGAGRIRAEAALDNSVLAYVVDDPGSVSVSFGPVEVTSPTTMTKSILVSNKGAAGLATYAVSYDALTTIPGVDYIVSPSSVTVPAGGSKIVHVSLSIPDPTKLTKTMDPTMDAIQGLPREFLADASGRVLLASSGRPTLRVPVYSAPRPASNMTQAAVLNLTPGAQQTGSLQLTGTNLNQGTGSQQVVSLASVFELQGVSGLAPHCSAAVDEQCVNNADERSADLKYVGTTSNFFGANHVDDGFAYFAISTHGPWHTPADMQEFDIYIDTNDNTIPDYVMYSTRLGDTDVFIARTLKLRTPPLAPVVVDEQLINDRFGGDDPANQIDGLDTALFDSDTLVMPVGIKALGLTAVNSRINYDVVSFSNQQGGPVDFIEGLSFDTLHPGISTGAADGLLWEDAPSALPVNRDLAAYEADNGLGALVVHYHNPNAHKAQVVILGTKVASSTTLELVPSSVKAGQKVTATATVANSAGKVPTGTITLKTSTGTTLGTGALDATGRATIAFNPKPAGSYSVHAEYSGDTTYLGSSSTNVSLTVTKNASTVHLKLPKTVKHGKKVTATVTVTTVYGVVPTGKVTIKKRTKTLGSGVLVNGKVKIKFTIAKVRTIKVFAKYAGDGSYLAGKSPKVTLKVT